MHCSYALHSVVHCAHVKDRCVNYPSAARHWCFGTAYTCRCTVQDLAAVNEAVVTGGSPAVVIDQDDLPGAPLARTLSDSGAQLSGSGAQLPGGGAPPSVAAAQSDHAGLLGKGGSSGGGLGGSQLLEPLLQPGGDGDPGVSCSSLWAPPCRPGHVALAAGIQRRASPMKHPVLQPEY